MKLKEYDFFIFDMDGVLIDSEPFWRCAEKEVFSLVGITLSDQDCMQTAGMRLDEVVNYWYQRHPWKAPTKEQVYEKIALRVKEQIISHGKPLGRVVEVLASLVSQGKVLALCSSSEKSIIQTVLSALKIEKYFSVVHSAEEELAGKPHPAAYLSTLKRLKADPLKTIVFEDSVKGCIAAKAAGLQVLALLAKEQNSKLFSFCDEILNSWDDFFIK